MFHLDIEYLEILSSPEVEAEAAELILQANRSQGKGTDRNTLS